MVDALARIMRRESDSDYERLMTRELDNVRRFTKAYQGTLDTNAVVTITVDYDFLSWMQDSFGADIAQYRLDKPMTLTIRRAHGRLPNAKLESVDASTCTQPQFTEWLYFIRNTRDYVAVTSAESVAA